MSRNESLRKLAAYVPYPWHHPVTMLRVVRPYEQAGIEVLHGCENGRVDPQLILQADAVLIQREFPAYALGGGDASEIFEHILQLAHHAGKPVIYEIDDLLLELPEEHPDHALHYYTAALIPMLRVILEADLVTTSTPVLQKYYQALNPNTHLLPNYLDDRSWGVHKIDVWEPVKKTETEGTQQDATCQPLIIGYMGSNSHVPDLEYVAPALLRIFERFTGRVCLRIWGAKPPELLINRPEVDWIALELFDYPAFAAYFSQQECDLFIAPLRDSFFNQCKSSIKYLEYSIRGVPGIYSRLAPYEAVIMDGQDGLLATTLEEWESALSLLIENPLFRMEVGRNARQNVLNKWLLSEHANQWAAFFEMVSRKTYFRQPETSADESMIFLRLIKRIQAWQKQLSLSSLDMQDGRPGHGKKVGVVDTHRTIQEEASQADLAQLRLQLANAQNQMDEILSSETWKIAQCLNNTRRALMPPGGLLDNRMRRFLRMLDRSKKIQEQAAPNENPEPGQERDSR